MVELGSLEHFRERVRKFRERELGDDWAGIGALAPDERDVFSARWREALRQERLLAPTWPLEYGGGGLGLAEQAALQADFVRAGVPVLPFETDQFAFTLIGPTLLHWGTPEQKAHFLPRMITAEDRWAQGYSEPAAGSDLFALSTRAVLEGDEWVVNGQKVWQTAAHHANWIFALVRTEPNQSGGRGISMLLIPLDQSGVEVRRIRTMTGEEEFCEVFFTDARTAAANVVGPRGSGAKVALTLLGFERGSASGALYASYRIEFDRLVDLVRSCGLTTKEWVRDRLAWFHCRLEMLRFLGERNLASALSGAPPGPESSIIKLYESEYHSHLTEFALEILGDDALAWRGDAGVAPLGPDPLGSPSSPAAWTRQFLTARAATIYGGSSEIQRNTLGEQILGLPREPRAVEQEASR